LAANLTDKGQVSTGSETLAALVAKVADVYTGRKSAFGKENYSISAGGADVTIALPFTPGFVAITYSYRGSALYRVSYHGFDSADADKSLSDSWGGDYTAAGISMQSSGFTIGASSSYPITVYNWIACEQLNV
jgi:hypothetical protein